MHIFICCIPDSLSSTWRLHYTSSPQHGTHTLILITALASPPQSAVEPASLLRFGTKAVNIFMVCGLMCDEREVYCLQES